MNKFYILLLIYCSLSLFTGCSSNIDFKQILNQQITTNDVKYLKHETIKNNLPDLDLSEKNILYKFVQQYGKEQPVSVITYVFNIDSIWIRQAQKHITTNDTFNILPFKPEFELITDSFSTLALNDLKPLIPLNSFEYNPENLKKIECNTGFYCFKEQDYTSGESSPDGRIIIIVLPEQKQILFHKLKIQY